MPASAEYIKPYRITFCRQNYILSTELHFVYRITFCLQNYIFCLQDNILSTELHFCGQNRKLWDIIIYRYLDYLMQ